MNKKEVKAFIDTHRDIEYSAAKLIYTLFVEENWEEMAEEIIGSIKKSTEDDLQMKNQILAADDPAALVNLMRKPMSFENSNHLREKLLDSQEQVYPLIQQKALRNGQDTFIENTIYFLLRCYEEPCDWIMENYSRFASEYLKGLLCLVLGCRGEAELIPFLIAEAERLERMYPKESYDQGAVIGVQELAYRFLN